MGRILKGMTYWGGPHDGAAVPFGLFYAEGQLLHLPWMGECHHYVVYGQLAVYSPLTGKLPE